MPAAFQQRSSLQSNRLLDRGIECGLMVVAAAILVADLNHFLEYLFIALAIIVLARQIASRSRRLARTSLDFPVFLFLGWILITIFNATDPLYTFAEWRKLFAHVLMFFLLVNFISSEAQVKRILGAFVVGVLLMSIYGIVEFFLSGGELVDQWHQRTVRADALTSEYHWFSTYLIMGLPIIAVWALFTDHFKWRVVLVVTLLIATFALFVTYTRGAWIAVLVQACVLVFLKGSKVIKLLVAGLVMVTLSTSFGAIIQSEQKNIPVESQSTQVEGDTMHLSTLWCRIHIWELGIKDVIDRPILGWGYGTKTFARKYHDIHVPGCPPKLHNIHSTYGSFAFGAGIPALCFFMWILWRILRTLWIGFLNGPSEFHRMIGLGLFLMTMGIMIRISFDVMFVGMLAVLFWMLVGLFFGLQRALLSRDLSVSRAM